MKTIVLNGVKYKLVPLNPLETAPSKEHELFLEILEASQRRAAGDPQWQMTDAEWYERWGVERPVCHKRQCKKTWETRREKYGPTGHAKTYRQREMRT